MGSVVQSAMIEQQLNPRSERKEKKVKGAELFNVVLIAVSVVILSFFLFEKELSISSMYKF